MHFLWLVFPSTLTMLSMLCARMFCIFVFYGYETLIFFLNKIFYRPKTVQTFKINNMLCSNPSYVIKTLRKDFDLAGLEGLCTIVPPSYIENFAEKHPFAYRNLRELEDKLKSSWPWKYIGDYYIISLRKKA